MTIATARQWALQTLDTVSDAPELDVDRLLLHVLKEKETSWLYAHAAEQLSAQDKREFQKLVQERATGKPLAYILGEWEFYGQMFYVTPDVLVPRPETENLITAALLYIDVWREKHPGEQMTIADVGTGSGIIAITLALEITSPTQKLGDLSLLRRGASPYQGEAGRQRTDEVQFLATDISPAALRVATKNAQQYGVADRIEFLEGDMLGPLKNKNIDLIVSNPPYVPTVELESHFAKASRLKIETKGLNFEPKMALDGGKDGQDFVRQVQASRIPALVETTNGAITSFPSSLLSWPVQ